MPAAAGSVTVCVTVPRPRARRSRVRVGVAARCGPGGAAAGLGVRAERSRPAPPPVGVRRRAGRRVWVLTVGSPPPRVPREILRCQSWWALWVFIQAGCLLSGFFIHFLQFVMQ